MMHNNNNRSNSNNNNNNQYERYTFPQTTSTNDITQTYLSEQLGKSLDHLALLENELHQLKAAANYDGDDGDDDDNRNHDKNHYKNEALNKNHHLHDENQQTMLFSIEYLSLAHAYATISSSMTTPSTDHYDINTLKNNGKLSNLCGIHKQLGQILLDHLPPPSQNSSSSDSSRGSSRNRQYSKLYQAIQTRYMMIFKHIHVHCILKLRTAISKAAAAVATQTPFHYLQSDNDDKDEEETIESIIKSLVQTQALHKLVMNHDDDDDDKKKKNDDDDIIHVIVREFMKPIIHRVQFHFLSHHTTSYTNTTNMNSNTENTAPSLSPSSSLMNEIKKQPERLIGWICTYIKDYIEENDLILLWDWIQSIIASSGATMQQQENEGFEIVNHDSTNTTTTFTTNHDSSSIPIVHEYFVQEMNQLIWLVLDKHDFYHKLKKCASITSTSSTISIPTTNLNGGNPLRICHAVESTLKFDDFTRQIISNCDNDDNVDDTEREQKIVTSLPLKATTLMDVFIIKEEQLFLWWLECERIGALNALKQKKKKLTPHRDSGKREEDIDPILLPFLESFASLIISWQRKSCHISHHGHQSFTQKIIIPVSVYFLECMHGMATKLKYELLGSSGKKIPNLEVFKLNARGWISIITGTELASHFLLLLHSHGNQYDITEVRRLSDSLHRLAEAMMEEMGTIIVEDLLLERTKLASYLMQCAHMFSLDGGKDVEKHHSYHLGQISPELQDTHDLLRSLCDVWTTWKTKCNHNAIHESIRDTERDRLELDVIDIVSVLEQTCNQMIQKVAFRVEEKFLEVALDSNNMISELRCFGCQIFSFDVSLITNMFENENLYHFKRLNDVINLISMDNAKFETIRNAMRDLLSNPLHATPRDEIMMFETLHVKDLEMDGTIYNEALNMIIAQGFQYLDLNDAVSIMKRKVVSHAPLK